MSSAAAAAVSDSASCGLLHGASPPSPCSHSSSPLDSALFATVGVRSRKHVFVSMTGDAVTDCHGPSRQGNGPGGPMRTGRAAMAASTCGQGLGQALTFSGLPAPEHGATSLHQPPLLLPAPEHGAASPRQPPHLVTSTLDSKPPLCTRASSRRPVVGRSDPGAARYQMPR
jgi:hypothetical protein